MAVRLYRFDGVLREGECARSMRVPGQVSGNDIEGGTLNVVVVSGNIHLTIERLANLRFCPFEKRSHTETCVDVPDTCADLSFGPSAQDVGEELGERRGGGGIYGEWLDDCAVAFGKGFVDLEGGD